MTASLLLLVSVLSVPVAQEATSRGDAPTGRLRIEWRLGPDYPMGIQDAAVGKLSKALVSAGGFTRHPLEIVKTYPDAFAGESSGFTRLSFRLDLKAMDGGWQRIADMPGPARQGPAMAVVHEAMFIMGGMSYSAPNTTQGWRRRLEGSIGWGESMPP